MTITRLTLASSRLQLRLANTDALREHGLMGVTELAKNQGMIFVFPDGNAMRYFWMKDTLIPLDMVFVSSAGIVTEVDENVAASRVGAPERTIARRRGVGRYVIELPAWNSDSAGIEPGTRLAVPELSAE